jgi:hypothetical protein
VSKAKSLVMEQRRVGEARIEKCDVNSEMSMKRKNRAPRIVGVQITKPVRDGGCGEAS